MGGQHACLAWLAGARRDVRDGRDVLRYARATRRRRCCCRCPWLPAWSQTTERAVWPCAGWAMQPCSGPLHRPRPRASAVDHGRWVCRSEAQAETEARRTMDGSGERGGAQKCARWPCGRPAMRCDMRPRARVRSTLPCQNRAASTRAAAARQKSSRALQRPFHKNAGDQLGGCRSRVSGRDRPALLLPSGLIPQLRLCRAPKHQHQFLAPNPLCASFPSSNAQAAVAACFQKAKTTSWTDWKP